MPVFTTGSTALSFTQQFLRQDPTKYVVGGLLYFYFPGTTTPLTGYSDPNATLPLPNPYTIAQDGRIPSVFFILTIDTVPVGYSSVRMRLVDAHGVLQFDFDNIPLMGPGGGGGGGGGDTTDPNSVLITGDLKPRYGVGTLPGFVRANGLTIGPLGSGSTERANADCQALFQYLWNNDANLVVVGGRGVSSQADWDSGVKQITLPDFSGCVMGFLDNMSGNPRNVLTTSSFNLPGQGPTVLGAKGGDEQRILTAGNLPVLTLSVTIPAGQGSHTHALLAGASLLSISGANDVASGAALNFNATTIASATLPQLTGTAPLGGSGQAFPIVQPSKLCTLYIRL